MTIYPTTNRLLCKIDDDFGLTFEDINEASAAAAAAATELGINCPLNRYFCYDPDIEIVTVQDSFVCDSIVYAIACVVKEGITDIHDIYDYSTTASVDVFNLEWLDDMDDFLNAFEIILKAVHIIYDERQAQ